MEVAEIILLTFACIVAAFFLALLLYTIIAPLKEEREYLKKKKKRIDNLYKRPRGYRPIEIVDLNGWREITLPQPKSIKTDPPITPPTRGSSAVPPKIEVKIILERAKDIDEKDSDERH